jgi:hypothetical protein
MIPLIKPLSFGHLADGPSVVVLRARSDMPIDPRIVQ